MYKVTSDIWRSTGIDREQSLFPERAQLFQAARLADKLINSSVGGVHHVVVMEDLETREAVNFTGIVLRCPEELVARYDELVNVLPYMEHEATGGYTTEEELGAARSEFKALVEELTWWGVEK